MSWIDIYTSFTSMQSGIDNAIRTGTRPALDVLHLIFDKAFYILLFIAVFVSVSYLLISIYAMLFHRKKQESMEFNAEKAPFVTVQIPTFNELAAIRCAKACLEFDYPKDSYEVIIGDDSNKKEISQKLDAFASQHSMVKITRRGSNIGYKAGNLNHMLKHSNGEVLVLFDSDFVPQADFLQRIVTPFMHDKQYAAVQARWKFSNPNQNLVSVLGSTIVSVFHHLTLPFIYRKKVSFLCGSAEAVRKDVLLKLGGWKTGSLTEDIEYSLRLLKNGYKIEYLEDLECEGEVPYVPKDLYKQQMRWAYGVIGSFKEHSLDLIKSRNLSLAEKFYIFLDAEGYFIATLLLMLFLTGALSFITNAPSPIDIPKFAFELGRNILFTSGLILASIYALAKTKNAKKTFAMVASSFSYGLLVTYYVNVGIFKVLTNKPMKWFMLNKNSNAE